MSILEGNGMQLAVHISYSFDRLFRNRTQVSNSWFSFLPLDDTALPTICKGDHVFQASKGGWFRTPLKFLSA